MYAKFGQIGIRNQVKYEKVPVEMGSFEDERSDQQQASEYGSPHHGLCRTIRLRTMFAIQVVLLTVYTFCFFIMWTVTLRKRSIEGHVIFSPAQEAVHYEPLEFDANLIIKNEYTGQPRPELDKAWDDLLQYANFRISGDDLRRLGRTSIPIPGEDDQYFAQMSVNHELHCLKRIRQSMHPDYYFTNTTSEEKELLDQHTDHCLDIIRQGIMCRADVTLFTLRWTDTSKVPAADFTGAHECVDWDSIYGWMQERSVDMLRPGWLVHPTKGVVWPHGEGDQIGVGH